MWGHTNNFCRALLQPAAAPERNSHKSRRGFQQPPFHALLLLTMSLSASSQLRALILAARAVLKAAAAPPAWGDLSSYAGLLWARAELTTAQSRHGARSQVGAALPGWPCSRARSLRHHKALL